MVKGVYTSSLLPEWVLSSVTSLLSAPFAYGDRVSSGFPPPCRVSTWDRNGVRDVMLVGHGFCTWPFRSSLDQVLEFVSDGTVVQWSTYLSSSPVKTWGSVTGSGVSPSSTFYWTFGVSWCSSRSQVSL